MRVVVTGAGGFIGSRVVGRLLAQGHEVIALVRGRDAMRRLAGWADRLVIHEVDLNEVALARKIVQGVRPDGVVHLAWYARPEDYLVSPRNLASLAMTTALVESALSAGCNKLVMGGTCVEYAAQGRSLAEDDLADPSTLYASCKHAAWLVSRALVAGSPCELSWARIFHLHGPGEDGRRLIPWVASQLRSGVAVELTGGAQVRDHLHVDDVAAGLVALLRPGVSGIYNVCSGQPVTLRHVLEMVGDLLGRGDLLRFGARPYRPGEVMFLAGDARRLRATGWAPHYGLRDGLRDALGGDAGFEGSEQALKPT
jgi:nucleoside-diphosphate-sugar epimerase